MAFNKVVLMGRLTADPTLKETPTGNKLVTFDLAVDRGYGENRDTDFFPCRAWSGAAETIAKHCRKGKELLVSGQLQNSHWEDNKGSKHTTTHVIVTEFSVCGTKESSSTTSSTEPRTSQPKPMMLPMDDDSDIPF